MNIYITNFNADFKNMYVCQAWINFHNTFKKKNFKVSLCMYLPRKSEVLCIKSLGSGPE